MRSTKNAIVFFSVCLLVSSFVKKTDAAWVEIDQHFKYQAFFIKAAPNHNRVYLDNNSTTLGNRFYVTVDDGATWDSLPTKAVDGHTIVALINSVVFDPADTSDNTIYFAGIYDSPGVYLTKDGGQTFSGLVFNSTETFAVDFSDPQRKTMLAVDHGGTLTMSTDGGLTQSSLMGNLATADVNNISVYSPAILDSVTFLVGTPAGTFRTTDKGQTWTKVSGLIPGQELLIAPNGTFVYGLASYAGVAESIDKGLLWTRTCPSNILASGIESHLGAYLPDGRLVYCKKFVLTTGPQQLMVSSDLANWTDFLTPFPATHMDEADQNIGITYCKASNKIYTSSRYGCISYYDLSAGAVRSPQLSAAKPSLAPVVISLLGNRGELNKILTCANENYRLFDLHGEEIKLTGANRQVHLLLNRGIQTQPLFLLTQ